MKYFLSIPLITIFMIITAPLVSSAQTDMDAIMMEKKQLCIGPMYSYSSWKNYWEGTLKRNNQNLGTISTDAFVVMCGILNNRFSFPVTP